MLTPTMHAAMVGLLGGSIYGYNSAIISGLGAPIVLCAFYFDADSDKPWEATDSQSLYEGLLTASVLFGGLLGTLASVPVADRIGRKRALQLTGLVGCSALLFLLDISFGALVLLRALVGVSVGATAALCPLYNSETTPTDMRGAIGTLFQVAICTMILVSYIVNYLFKTDYDPDGPERSKFCLEDWPNASDPMLQWRLQLALGAIPAAALLVYGFVVPETEFFFKSRGGGFYKALNADEEVAANEKIAEAAAAAAANVETSVATSPFTDDDEGHEGFAMGAESGWGALWSATGWRWNALGLGLGLATQLTGINAIIY